VLDEAFAQPALPGLSQDTGRLALQFGYSDSVAMSSARRQLP